MIYNIVHLKIANLNTLFKNTHVTEENMADPVAYHVPIINISTKYLSPSPQQHTHTHTHTHTQRVIAGSITAMIPTVAL